MGVGVPGCGGGSARSARHAAGAFGGWVATQRTGSGRVCNMCVRVHVRGVCARVLVCVLVLSTTDCSH